MIKFPIKNNVKDIYYLKVGDIIWRVYGNLLVMEGPLEVVSFVGRLADIDEEVTDPWITADEIAVLAKNRHGFTRIIFKNGMFWGDETSGRDTYIFRNEEDATDFIFHEKTLRDIKNG